MWNQTGEADWCSEMDRHSPTGPCLCCQRSVDYMTEGGMRKEGEAGGYKCLYGGIHPSETIAFPPKVAPSSHKNTLYTNFTFVRHANQPALVLACCCDAGHRVVRLLLLTTLIISNDCRAAVLPSLTCLTMIRWPFSSPSRKANE